EIWLEILDSVSRDTLPSVSLTNRRFRALSTPLLFAHFVFHPYAVGVPSKFLLPEAENVENALQRLAFWSSEFIAPNVRSCSATAWSTAPPGVAST
ncbi:hypothetical protein C8F01DRAFT_919655, partial [Mycena amicta]